MNAPSEALLALPGCNTVELGRDAARAQPRMAYSRIAGLGSYAPELRLTNTQLNGMLGIGGDWIESRTGIRERRIAGSGQATSDLACEAGRHALHSSGLRPADIDLLVVATVTPDTPMPSAACRVQHMLECRRAVAFDVSAACSGFTYALSIADNFIRTKAARTALVFGADTFSRIMNYQDRSTCILFGDGAGALVLEPARGTDGIISTQIFSDGSGAPMLEIPAGGSRLPASRQSVDAHLHSMVMSNGQDVFRIAVTSLCSAVTRILDENNLDAGDIGLLVPHQANARILEAVRDRLGLSPRKIFTNVERFGNTSAASIPLALDEAVKGGWVKPGDWVVLASFGAGFTWGSALIRWG